MRFYINMRTVFPVLIVLLLVSTINITTSFAQDSPSVSVFEHPDDVEIIDFGYSPNSATFVTVTHKDGASGTIYLWDVATGTLRNTINHPNGSVFHDVDFSPDSTMLASASEDRKIYLWDVATHSLVKTLVGHTDGVVSVAFSPDGQTLASGSGDQDETARLWDVVTGTLTDTIDYSLDNAQFNVYVIFSPDGRILATQTYRAIHFWDVMNGRHLHNFTDGHNDIAGNLYHFAFSPDSTTFVNKFWDSSAHGRTARDNLGLWNVATGGHLQTFSAEYAYYPVFSPDGSKLAASGEGGIHLWDVATGALLNLFYPGFEHSDFSPNGRTLVTAGHANVYKAINVWDVATGEVINTLTLPEPHDYIGVQDVQYSPDGTTIAAVKSFFDDQVVFLWRLAPTVTITFTPSTVADQMFEVGTPVNLTLPSATGGTAPYTYTLTPIPNGLQFDATTLELHGTPLTPMNATPVTYTATDAAGTSASLTFTIEVIEDAPGPGTDVYMYWTSWGLSKIQRASLNGSNLQDLVTGLTWPRDIALDIVGNKMYWVDAGANKVQRANLDGTNVEDLVNTQGHPFGVAVDTTNGKMYWSIWNPGKIQRANLDGTNVEDFVTGLSEPEDIDLDLSRGKIYWTDTVTNKIQRANLDGTNIEDLVTVGLSHPLGLTLDVAGGKIYWTNSSFHPGPWPGLDKIQRANLDGTNVEDLVTTGLVAASGIDLDLSDGKMYWTDIVTNKIQRANLDGSSVEDVIVSSANALINPNSLALGIPQAPPSDGLRFSPSEIADQTFTVGTAVSLTLPTAIGGNPPYTHSLAPPLPAGLYFDPIANGPGYIGGTPTVVMQPTDFTYAATDTTGASAALTFSIEVIEDGTGPGAEPLDVNRDGQVTVIDLAIVALFYGTRVSGGVSLPADVNADGVVDLADLIAVAQGIDAAGGGLNQFPLWEVEAAFLAAVEQAAEIEAVAGAPMGFGTHVLPGEITSGNVAAALLDVKHLATGDVHLGKELAVLSELLYLLAELTVTPETTALLPNYPNPFNPETWIPYHLSKAADVTLTVYDMRGVSVRELVLGHQGAGVYQSRGRAAYWDGRNSSGEPVASGVYFYTLTAGDFTATRKMLIRK